MPESIAQILHELYNNESKSEEAEREYYRIENLMERRLISRSNPPDDLKNPNLCHISSLITIFNVPPTVDPFENGERRKSYASDCVSTFTNLNTSMKAHLTDEEMWRLVQDLDRSPDHALQESWVYEQYFWIKHCPIELEPTIQLLTRWLEPIPLPQDLLNLSQIREACERREPLSSWGDPLWKFTQVVFLLKSCDPSLSLHEKRRFGLLSFDESTINSIHDYCVHLIGQEKFDRLSSMIMFGLSSPLPAASQPQSSADEAAHPAPPS